MKKLTFLTMHKKKIMKSLLGLFAPKFYQIDIKCRYLCNGFMNRFRRQQCRDIERKMNTATESAIADDVAV